jgi:TonB family protein
MGAGSDAGPHFCLGHILGQNQRRARRILPTTLQLFSLSRPDCWPMEGSIFAVVLGLLAIMAQPSEAQEQPAAGASIDSEAQPRRLPVDQNDGDRKPATRATANLVSLFSTDDYPREAWRNGEQGIVAVTLTVSPDGKVADCVVNQSSGSPSLDVQTCRILWTRAHFTPARDAQGRPVQDTFHQRIRWELPEGNPADMEERFSRLILAVDTERAVVDCRYEASQTPKSMATHCPGNIEAMQQLISSAPDWIPFAGREIVFETQQRVGDPQGGVELGERQGEFQLLVARLYLTIDAAGNVKSCSTETWGPMRSPNANFTCEFAKRWKFEELPKQESNRNDRQLTVVNAAYLRKPPATLPSN